jgi:signal transduction histidine kinase
LATAAGIAIDNARLYAAAGRRQRWLEATAEITNSLVGVVDRTSALRLVADRAQEVAGAAVVAVLLVEADDDELRVEVTASESPDLAGMSVPLAGTPFQTVLQTGEHVLVADLARAASWPVAMPSGPALVAPLASTSSVQGVLVVGLPADSLGFGGDTDVNMIITFAAQAALALERAQAQEERQLLVVLEDRERIARDLHDVVIQRLFAAGLSLQSMSRLVGRDDVRARLDATVTDLDTTIHDIRSAIFELRAPAAASLQSNLLENVGAAAEALGFRPSLHVTGPIDRGVPVSLRAEILAVLGEALSNVVRHAQAHTVSVDVTVAGDRISLSVTDDGVGLDADAAGGSGLANMRHRAEDHGGDCTVTAAMPKGTRLTWSVPLAG